LDLANDDVIWFKQRQRRKARIRRPAAGEFDAAWRWLGDHDATRRHVVVAQCPRTPATPDGLMRVPFLAHGDETIEDSDEIGLRILDEIMKEAAKQNPVGGFIQTGDAGGFPGWRY
jgi:hypothetical protein